MQPLVMGVVNVTPDSFSDGGRFARPDHAVAHGRSLAAQGAAWIDVGGESTRPGATPVAPDEESRRVLPVVEALAADGLAVSIDTRHEAVARAAVRAGATMINDVGAGLGPLAAELGVAWVAVHLRGDPATMQDDPRFDDVVGEVRDELVRRAADAVAAGAAEVWLDPGIGFGKTTAHNLALLAHLDALVGTGFPVLVGVSRKGFLGRLTAEADAADHSGGPADPARAAGADDRLEASLAAATVAMAQGARMVRVHDVRATVHAAEVVGGSIPAVAA